MHMMRDARANLALAASTDCVGLGVRSIRRVADQDTSGRLVRPASNASLAWKQGHFPYKDCGDDVDGPAMLMSQAMPPRPNDRLRPLTVLMVSDIKYAARIPAWAAEVTAMGIPCAVGDVSGSDPHGTSNTTLRPCAAAAASGCECFSPPTRAPALHHKWDINGVMALAVRWRFLYAKELLARGRSVLMHDADVFFHRGDALDKVSRWINETWQTARMDFAVQDNGRRRETYDDLNWGFVWMSGSATSVRLLGCTLDAWRHPAFAPPREKPHSAYHARSHTSM